LANTPNDAPLSSVVALAACVALSSVAVHATRTAAPLRSLFCAFFVLIPIGLDRSIGHGYGESASQLTGRRPAHKRDTKLPQITPLAVMRRPHSQGPKVVVHGGAHAVAL
jgi:hypothetical protein